MTSSAKRYLSRSRAGTLAGVLLALHCHWLLAAPPYRYEVRVDPSLERLSVEACFDGPAPLALVAESDAAKLYLQSMRIGTRALEPAGDEIILQGADEHACINYEVKLQAAQNSAQTGGPETRRVGRGAMLTAIGDWLWRPREPGPDIELRFQLPAGIGVSAPWPRRPGNDGRPVFLASATPHGWPGIVAFGHFAARDIAVPGAVVHVALLDMPAQQAELAQWIENTARNVALLYGRFPVTSLQVVVSPTPRGRGPVPWAYVARGGGPAVHLFINPSRPAEEFARDWSLTHEMSHLFLPYVVSRDAWLFEGLPTYLQNVLMARGGAIGVEEAWRRMQEGFLRGARTAPELSLARASERIGRNGVYLRVYWAGAAIMLAADLQLRAQTGGKQSLATALEQLMHCCLDSQRRWSAQEIIARLDEVTGTAVFSDLVRSQFDSDRYPDFESALTRAGVKLDGKKIELDASAPWAAERDAVMRPVPQ